MPGTRRRAVEGEQRSAQIIDAAEHAIATHGFEGLRVRDVADQVGINIATLHYYFATKEALVAAVAQRIARAFEPPPPTSPTDDARRVLVEHIEHIERRFETARSQFVVLNELYARASRGGEPHRVLRASDEAWAGYLRATFVAGLEQGRFRADLDPDGATALVIGFFKSLIHQLDLTADRLHRATDEILRAVSASDSG